MDGAPSGAASGAPARGAGRDHGRYPAVGHRAGSRGLTALAERRRTTTSPGLLARRLALLALFEDEFRPSQAVAALERLAADKNATPAVREHARRIVLGVAEHRPQLDGEIARFAPLIPVSELGRVERTILRSALFEVLYSAATPSGETIHDAVSLARTYAGDAARRLVKGVLGSVARSTGSAASGRGA